jgi:hypothetical protein
MQDAGSTSPLRFSLRTLLVASTCVAVVVAGGAELKRRHDERSRVERERALRADIPIHLRTIHGGLCYYAHGTSKKNEVTTHRKSSWPPRLPQQKNGSPLYSWRLPILLAVEWSCGCLYEEGENLEASWKHDGNLEAVERVGRAACLGDPTSDSQTHVFGITGTDTAFDSSAASDFASLPDDIIVAMEVRDANTECFEPGDYDVADLLAYRGKIGDHLHGLIPGRIHILFADGKVWSLYSSAPIADLQPFFTITGATMHDRDELLAPHKVY